MNLKPVPELSPKTRLRINSLTTSLPQWQHRVTMVVQQCHALLEGVTPFAENV